MDWTGQTPLTFERVADFFGITVKTVRNWTEGRGTEGRVLDSWGLGGKVFTTMEAVNKFTQVRRPQVVQTAAAKSSALVLSHSKAQEELHARFGTR